MSDESREEKLAQIRARAEALRAAKAGAAPAAAPTLPGKAAPGGVPAPATPANIAAAPAAPGRTTPGGPAAPAAPAKSTQGRPASPSAGVDVPVSSLNPGGRPAAPPQSPALEASGTPNQSIEIRADPSEAENIKKILGGLGAYQNPLRGGAWQIDYRYYAEARRRLEAAGYLITERDFMGRPLSDWSPTSRGWTRVES